MPVRLCECVRGRGRGREGNIERGWGERQRERESEEERERHTVLMIDCCSSSKYLVSSARVLLSHIRYGSSTLQFNVFSS